ncbi:MAG: type VI secretion system contractile sheath large subunit [Verrucomicrobia bacterium]|nr:type VI secretion system contractile sheath large subunit [Verrucomicrobiota bacterium]
MNLRCEALQNELEAALGALAQRKMAFVFCRATSYSPPHEHDPSIQAANADEATMSNSSKFGFDFTFNPSGSTPPREPDAPLQILVLADFGGRTPRGLVEPLSTRKIQRVDIDNLDGVFAGFGASLALALPCGPAALRFASLEDFHPDPLLQRVAPLSELLAVRRALQSSSTAGEAAAKLQQLLGAVPPSAPATTVPEVATAALTPSGESTETTLARLLGQAPAAPAPAKPAAGFDAQALIRQIVGGSKSATPAAAPGSAGLVSAAELELAARLRSVLHDPGFQSLEAAWRLLDWLVRRCPDEERVKFAVLDASLAELAADLTGLHRRLRDQPPDLVVGNFTFGASQADLELLGALAKLCAALRATFLAAGDSRLAGCESFALHPDPDDWTSPAPADVRETWQKVRATPEAAHVALALPRFLLRQPYGAGSDRIESFSFEEVPDASRHETFLWGNPAFLCAQLLAESFAGHGTLDSSGGDIGELPVFRFKQDGESAMKPCAEAWLVDRAGERLLKHGLVPCLSIKGRDAVRVAGLAAISSAAPELKTRR